MAQGRGRRLVLFRHAKSAWPDVADHERPLAGRGRRDAPVMGRWLRDAGCAPDQVLCSTARRARETWQLAETRLGATPPVSFEPAVYHESAAGLLELIRQAPPAARTLLVVGHNPAIQDAALLLAVAAPEAAPATAAGPGSPGALQRMRAKFPTAAIAVLESTGSWAELEPGRARLTRFTTPGDLATGPAVSRQR